MRLRFWGTRGSFVSPGPAFQRYGGNTICMDVSTREAQLVFDLGTGCIPLGTHLMGSPGRKLSVLLSHTHIDHIQGLPFFLPALVPGWNVTIMGPAGTGQDISAILDGALNPNYSPLYGLENLAAKLEMRTLAEEEFDLDGIRVRSALLPHGTTQALGFRLECDGMSVAFLTDVEYNGDPPPVAIDLAAGVDVLIHDAMDTAHDVVKRHGFSQTSPDDAVRVAREAGAKRLLLYHHDPDRTDSQMDHLLDRTRRAAPGLAIDGAREGDVLEL